MSSEARLHQMRWRNTLTFLGIGVWSIEIAPVRLIVGVSEFVLGWRCWASRRPPS
ncbi:MULTISPECIES: hypothetical protein [Halomonadaceae]|uniref:Uncharacterized protein n=1 Tax=Modicisalibacter zincidurans TaxID=1178777 RepID=A0ABP9RFA5_9GAMM|nr:MULTISPECIES: hypothetical protein [Halomonas]MCD6009479.1 hypothetical protein [Halomonas sp. IOP_31]